MEMVVKTEEAYFIDPTETTGLSSERDAKNEKVFLLIAERLGLRMSAQRC